MTASFTPAGAAEFPNDNPALHRGVRWVCPSGQGPARAVWRASSDDAASAVVEPARAAAEPALTREPEAAPRRSPARAKAPGFSRRCAGPLELDLDRIVIPHRVEDVPPPPDFIYEPFVSSRAVSAASPGPRPIHPRPCRVVDARQARSRVLRGWRVDVAPCVDVGAGELLAASA